MNTTPPRDAAQLSPADWIPPIDGVRENEFRDALQAYGMRCIYASQPNRHKDSMTWKTEAFERVVLEMRKLLLSREPQASGEAVAWRSKHYLPDGSYTWFVTPHRIGNTGEEPLYTASPSQPTQPASGEGVQADAMAIAVKISVEDLPHVESPLILKIVELTLAALYAAAPAPPVDKPKYDYCEKHRKWPCAECGTSHYEGCDCPICVPRSDTTATAPPTIKLDIDDCEICNPKLRSHR